MRDIPQAERDALSNLKNLITRIARVSGNPRGACWRFARQAGLSSKRDYQPWTVAEQQKLLELIAVRPLAEAARVLRRSPTSVRSMLHRLGANTRMGEDWFTKYSLARALHIRSEEVQKWIDRGWLKCRTLACGSLEREVIDAEEFCRFCKQHQREVIGHRLNWERLDFVQTFVFPPNHADLLPVREAKKEQAAYDEQMQTASGRVDDEREPDEKESRAVA